MHGGGFYVELSTGGGEIFFMISPRLLTNSLFLVFRGFIHCQIGRWWEVGASFVNMRMGRGMENHWEKWRNQAQVSVEVVKRNDVVSNFEFCKERSLLVELF